MTAVCCKIGKKKKEEIMCYTSLIPEMSGVQKELFFVISGSIDIHQAVECTKYRML